MVNSYLLVFDMRRAGVVLRSSQESQVHLYIIMSAVLDKVNINPGRGLMSMRHNNRECHGRDNLNRRNIDLLGYIPIPSLQLVL
jgi:hypothetical protein